MSPSPRFNLGLTISCLGIQAVGVAQSWHTWEQPAAFGPAIFDLNRQRLVFFGTSQTGSLWEWDQTAQQRSLPLTGPLPRDGFAIAYDNLRSRAILFGGFRNGTYYSDTWSYDGINWTRLFATSGPFAR